MIKKEPQRITQRQLVRMFEDIKRLGNSDDSRFCFLIGAGASKSSGIDTGWELSVRWYNELKEVLDNDVLSSWKKEVDFNEKRIGEFYPNLYRKRYETSPQIGYDEFKKMMENKEPGLGYVILSQILAYEKHNFVITTNFDYLIEDSIRTFTDTKPFVAGHETLAEFIASNTERPTIIKVHRDLFLHPFNDVDEISKLKTEWANALKPILSRFNLLVIGYGGNDGSLMDYLKDIDSNNRKAIYWCVREGDELKEKITSLLTQKDFIVTIDGFDEFMLHLCDALGYQIFDGLEKPDKHHFVKSATKRLLSLRKKLRSLPHEYYKKGKLNTVPKVIFKGDIEILYNVYSEIDIDKQEKRFLEGIKQYPESAILLNAYAMFLHETRKDYGKAEEYYKKSIDADPNDYTCLGNYAVFLDNIRKNNDEAEKYYKKSIEIDSKEAIFLGNYAEFLYNTRKDYGKAEEYYKKSIDADPKDATNCGNYATFLHNTYKDYGKAEEYYKKSIDADPKDATNYGNYAHLILLFKKDFAEAAKYINKALELVLIDDLELLSELWFYRFAHYSKWHKQGEKELEKLIAKGAKSLGWDFQSHIPIAEETGHPKIEKLKEFARKLTE